MVPDALVEFWLGNGRIVHFAMAVAAVADDVDNHVAAELRAVFRGHSPGAHDGIGIFAVHVENGHGLPLGDVGSEARGMLLVRLCGSSPSPRPARSADLRSRTQPPLHAGSCTRRAP